MKRFLSILLVAVLAFGMMATSALAAGITVETKDEATVTLKATDVTFQSCLATIDFDHSKLELTDVKAGEILPSGTKDVSKVTAASEVEGVNSMFAWNADNAGKAMIAYACGSDISSNGIVFTLTFKLKDGVEKAEVNAAVTFYDENNKDGDKIVPIETSTSAPAIIEVKASGVVIGDVDGNGKVNGLDLLRLKKYLAKVPDTVIVEANTSPINGKEGVNGQDLLRLQKYLAKVPGTVLG